MSTISLSRNHCSGQSTEFVLSNFMQELTSFSCYQGNVQSDYGPKGLITVTKALSKCPDVTSLENLQTLRSHPQEVGMYPGLSKPTIHSVLKGPKADFLLPHHNREICRSTGYRGKQNVFIIAVSRPVYQLISAAQPHKFTDLMWWQWARRSMLDWSLRGLSLRQSRGWTSGCLIFITIHYVTLSQASRI